MKAVIGSVQTEIRLLLIGPLIIIVAKLMMNSNEIVAINLGAHLDTDIVLVVDIPGTGVADELPILGLCDHRPGPKGFWQRRKSQRAVTTFTVFHPFPGPISHFYKHIRRESCGEVVGLVVSIWCE